MKKIVIVLLSINLIFSCVLGIVLFRIYYVQPDGTITQYVMYVGTNDKDTYEQIISTDDAKAVIDTACQKYLEEYTLQEAVGSWVDEKGIVTHEETIICIFDSASEEEVYAVADQVIKELNQNTVLIEKSSVRMDFYGGN